MFKIYIVKQKIYDLIDRYEYKTTLNNCTKLWLASWASHNIALAGPAAFWLASGHRASEKPDPCCFAWLKVVALPHSLIIHLHMLWEMKS